MPSNLMTNRLIITSIYLFELFLTCSEQATRVDVNPLRLRQFIDGQVCVFLARMWCII